MNYTAAIASPPLQSAHRQVVSAALACAVFGSCGVVHALWRGDPDALALKLSLSMQASPNIPQTASLPHASSGPSGACATRAGTASATITELVESARSHNPDVARALAQIRRARADVDLAESAYSPQLRVGASGGAAGAKIGLASAANVQLSKLLHDFGKTDALIEEARMRQESRLQEHVDTVDRLTLETVEAWVAAGRHAENARLHSEAARALEEAVRIIRLRAEAGLVGSGDVELAQARLAQVRAAGLAACTQREQALARLSVLSGRPVSDVVVAVPAPLLRDGPVSAWDPSARPSVRQAEAEHRAAAQHVQSVKASRWPSLSLQASKGAGTRGQAGSATSINLALTLDVLEAGTAARIESAVAEVEAAFTRVQAARDAAESLLRQTQAELRGVDTRRPLLQSQAASTASTQRNFLDQFLAGRRQVVDLLNTHQEVLAAELALAQLGFDRLALVARLHGLHGDLADAIAAPSAAVGATASRKP